MLGNQNKSNNKGQMTGEFGQLGRKMTSYYNFRFLRRHHSANNVLKFEY